MSTPVIAGSQFRRVGPLCIVYVDADMLKLGVLLTSNNGSGGSARLPLRLSHETQLTETSEGAKGSKSQG